MYMYNTYMYAFSFAVMKREQYNKVDLWVEPPPHSMHSATNDFLEKLKQLLASKENNLRQHTYVVQCIFAT